MAHVPMCLGARLLGGRKSDGSGTWLTFPVAIAAAMRLHQTGQSLRQQGLARRRLEPGEQGAGRVPEDGPSDATPWTDTARGGVHPFEGWWNTPAFQLSDTDVIKPAAESSMIEVVMTS